MSRMLVLLVITTLAVAGAFSPLKFSARSNARASTSLDGTIYEELGKEGNYKTLIAAIDAAGMKEVYDSEGTKTLLAPNDDAFSRVDVDSLLKDQDSLRELLLFHTHFGKMDPSRNGRTFDTGVIMEDGFAKQLTIKVTSWTSFRYVIDGGNRPAPAQIMDKRGVQEDGSVGGCAGEFYQGLQCDNGLVHELSEVLQIYEGSEPPIVTALGARDLEGTATLQRGFQGELADFGMGFKGDADFVNKDFNSGMSWKEAGNYDKQDTGRGGYVKNEKGGDLSKFYSKQNSGRPDELQTTGKRRNMKTEAEILEDAAKGGKK